jgi:ligand-binding SRPBCC domain-containing protein
MQGQGTTTADSAGTLSIARAAVGGFRLEAEQWLPVARSHLFEFFSDAFQLEAITPPWLKFKVLSPGPLRLESGTLIDYRLRIHGVPLHWQSRISVWEPPDRFVDEQLRGPYGRWHHEHIFTDCGSGTLCRDVVDYTVPGGALVHALLVRRDLRTIFAYRQQKLRELFSTRPR